MATALRLACVVLAAAAEVGEDEDFPEFPTRTVVPPAFPVRSQQHTYTLETVVAAVALVYLATYFMGKRKNDKLAISWLHTVKPLFDENFSHVGVSEKPDGPLMQQEANHSYKFFASGRANCAYCLLTLEMKKRQDLLSACLQAVWPERDRMVIEIPIKPAEPLPLVFALCRKAQAKQFRAGSDDLVPFTQKNLTAVCKFDELSNFYAVLAENDESIRCFLSSKNLSALHSLALGSLESLVISDQRIAHSGFPMTLRAECNLPSDPKDYQEMTKVCQLMLKFVDLTCSFKLSATAKAASEKERQIQMESKLKEQKAAREEELQKKKLEAKKKEEEKKQNLSKEQQRKLEEKEYRQSLKKKGVKTKMIKA